MHRSPSASSHRPHRRATILLAAGLALASGACGGGSDAAPGTTSSSVAGPGLGSSTTPSGGESSGGVPSTLVATSAPPTLPTSAPTATTAVEAASPAPSLAPSAPAPSSPPPPTPPPSLPAPPAPLVPLSLKNAHLAAKEQPYDAHSLAQGPTAPCAQLGHSGWTLVGCDRLAYEGMVPRAWIVERKGAGWRVNTFVWSQGKGAWLSDYEYLDESGSEVIQIGAKVVDIRKNGGGDLVVAYRSKGSGVYLFLDILAGFGAPGATPALGGAVELDHGNVQLGTNELILWDARYPNGAALCCPPVWQQSRLFHNGDGFVTQEGIQAIPDKASALP